MTSPEPPLTQLGRALADVDDLKSTVTHLTDVLNTERATRRRWRVTMAVLIPLSVLNLVTTGIALVSLDRLNDIVSCIVPGTECSARLAQQGLSGLVRQMDFQACWAAIPIEERGPDVFESCKAKILDQVVSNEGGKP